MSFLPLNKLRDWCAQYGLSPSPEAWDRFDDYAAFLVGYNEKVNLTAITEPEAVALLHFLDSLLLLDACSIPAGGSLIDVGTGAGFPGLPVKLARPDLELTLLDSLNKRIVFLNELTGRLGVACRTVHARSEEAGQQQAFRERFDVATARAVAALPVLCEYCLPLVRVGGVFAALKSRSAAEECAAAADAIRLLGGKLEPMRSYTLPDGSERSIVLIRKISQTPSKYPRPSAKMAKKPL